MSIMKREMLGLDILNVLVNVFFLKHLFSDHLFLFTNDIKVCNIVSVFFFPIEKSDEITSSTPETLVKGFQITLKDKVNLINPI